MNIKIAAFFSLLTVGSLCLVFSNLLDLPGIIKTVMLILAVGLNMTAAVGLFGIVQKQKLQADE
ncbi:hypothetical protein [Jeotgalibacillus sp. R-1-5s-1]|uniref:hypothetical protein n=1 Tax=Jeotgalibacillus sp. R-1-5s-1 TaxID=2555897 RepID=UPI00106D1161|nr:hypothetical protein [Jeotgalibacillus sp. R-1-5s-1]TFD94527.1 hypothetical protein E2491_13955 [Jeotgalibacillus sp. R-1-5s-1]